MQSKDHASLPSMILCPNNGWHDIRHFRADIDLRADTRDISRNVSSPKDEEPALSKVEGPAVF